MLNQGGTLQQIADQMCIAPGTVKNHVYHIYKKTGVTNRVELLKLLGIG